MVKTRVDLKKIYKSYVSILDMARIGKVRDLSGQYHFEWEISDFFSLLEEDGKFYFSPSFSFAGASWYFGICPKIDSSDNSIGSVGVYLYRIMPGSSISLAWSFGLKTFDGKKDQVKQFTHTFEEAGGRGSSQLLKRSVISEKKKELVPSGILTLFCTISVENDSKSADGAGNTVKPKCSYCKQVLVAACLSSHERNCLDKPIRCPTCSDVVELRKWFDHVCETVRVKASEKLANDLATIIDSEEHSDLTISVKDKEFRLHRSILASRNPYFSSMLKTEMKEKTTGFVSIDDCEPDVFRSLIHFVYTGKIQTLSSDNVCSLYEVADKYQEDQLKEECLSFMRRKISVDSFCDFVVLSLKYDEKELLQNATDLFCRETKNIIQSVKWQTFMRDYPTQANELYIKALDKNAE